MNKPTVILTGAGASIPWGAPTTWDITKELLVDTTFRSLTGQPIGDWIYHQLAGLYHKDPETINFETIINALEYLSTFFSSKEKESVSKFKNLMPAFFQEKDIVWDILWFDKIYKKTDHAFWESHNEFCKTYSYWNSNGDFFIEVHRHFINKIVLMIEKYASIVHEKSELNNHLNVFLKTFTNPLRCYTTNYDRIIPQVYQNEIFEGFTKNGSESEFNFKTVLTDGIVNTYYNMHGSVHYELDFPGNVKYSDQYIYNFGSGASTGIDQDQRKMINSNIITGFNKSSRILTNPYSQFYLRFYQDCLLADKIFIIGYSFSDIHINSAIKASSLANPNLKIICITLNSQLYSDHSNLESTYDWLNLSESRSNNFLNDVFRNNIYGGIVDTMNIERISIFQKGFKSFLEERQWKKI